MGGTGSTEGNYWSRAEPMSRQIKRQMASQCGHSGVAICVPLNHLWMPECRAGMCVQGRRRNTSASPGANQAPLALGWKAATVQFACCTTLAESAEAGAPLLPAAAPWRMQRNASAFQQAFAACMLHVQRMSQISFGLQLPCSQLIKKKIRAGLKPYGEVDTALSG